MSTAAAELQFAAQFASLAVAAAGVLLVVMRRRPAATDAVPVVPAPVAGRLALAIGLAGVGAAALVDGLQLGVDATAAGVVRAAAGAAVAAGGIGWRRSRVAGVLAASGGLAWAAAGVVALATGAPTAASAPSGSAITVIDAALLTGALLVAVGLLGASRSSVAARVAGASAAVLIALVLVLSAALGSAITSSLQAAQVRSLTSRAGVEAAQISSVSTTAVEVARFAGAYLGAQFAATTPNPLVDGDGPALAPALERLDALFPLGGFAYVAGQGTVAAAAGDLDTSTAAVLASAPGISGPSCSGGGSGGAALAGGAPWAVAAFPVCVGSDPVGDVVRGVPLDHRYLASRAAGDPATAVVLVTADGAESSGPPPAPAAVGLGRRATAPTGEALGEIAAAVQPVRGPTGTPVAALVVEAPLSAEVSARTHLLHTLFIVALGGTVLGLVLAALVGDRITAGVRRLTGAAVRVQGGDTTARAGVGGDDEVGTLGSAFDAMVVAIEEQTVDLERAAADEARLRDRLEAVVAGVGDALVAVDAAGRITDFNPAAVALTGIDAADALGATVDDVLELTDDHGRPVLPALLAPGAAEREPLVALLGVGRGNGRGPVPVAATAGGLTGTLGEPAGAVVVLRDLRREQEVERMKSEFLSRIGHELRTPLTGILGYAQLLVRYGDEVPAGRGPQFAGEILSSSRRLLRIVEMLEFIAGEGAGRLTFRPEPVEVAALVDRVVGGWVARTPDGVTITRRLGRRLPDVEVDRRWITLALDELVDNAVKFSPGGGQIEVRASTGHDADDAWVEIAVRDQGKGMTADEQAAMFTDFAQGDSSDTRSYGGLGLGLAIVSRVVDGQGGTVSCRSKPGKGSTFTIRLPARSR